MKPILRNLFLIAAVFGAPCLSYAQMAGPTVEIPTTHPTLVGANSEDGLTMAGEYKSTKNVVEQEKLTCYTWDSEIGYTSEYIFRGTNLMPDSDGGGFLGAQVSRWGFTLGVWGIHQFGEARAPGWSIGEGGGGGSGSLGSGANASNVIRLSQRPQGETPDLMPETIQKRFNEVDLFLQYHIQFGWIDVTMGNLAFFIDRRAETFLDIVFPDVTLHFRPSGMNTVQNEQFDRLYVSLSTSKIPHVTPKITYYQTVYSEGSEPITKLYLREPDIIFPFIGVFHRIQERNDALGGYLEGRLNGNFHITDRVDVNPYGFISYSFDDRTEPIENPRTLEEIIQGRRLNGFNHAQIGLEIPILLFHWTGVSTGPCAPPDPRLKLVPSGWYSYHISDPTAGTDRNEWWGGAKLALSF